MCILLKIQYYEKYYLYPVSNVLKRLLEWVFMIHFIIKILYIIFVSLYFVRNNSSNSCIPWKFDIYLSIKFFVRIYIFQINFPGFIYLWTIVYSVQIRRHFVNANDFTKVVNLRVEFSQDDLCRESQIKYWNRLQSLYSLLIVLVRINPNSGMTLLHLTTATILVRSCFDTSGKMEKIYFKIDTVS